MQNIQGIVDGTANGAAGGTRCVGEVGRYSQFLACVFEG
jgi:hypothetical protein